jgi:uncharacterized protein (TIGR02391 family)
MENLLHYVPDPENLLALEPEELAGYILEYLNALSYQERTRWLNRNSFASPFYILRDCPPNYQSLTSEKREEIIEALMEAWFWLEHENILAPKPDANRDQFFITRRGRRLRKAADLEAHRKANLLPKDLLHPSIAQKIWPAFLSGEYDPAVFLAFREVEIAVRQAGGFEPTAHGVPLMRRAFHPTQGPLRDQTNPDEGEREALASLFAGAIGSYKNPHSHRDVPLTAEDAVEMIMLANHLLRIVEARARKIK